MVITSVISTEPRMIGAASSLYGATQMANGALCTLIVGIFPANPALSAASVLLAGILFGRYFFLRATRPRSGAGASSAAFARPAILASRRPGERPRAVRCGALRGHRSAGIGGVVPLRKLPPA